MISITTSGRKEQRGVTRNIPRCCFQLCDPPSRLHAPPGSPERRKREHEAQLGPACTAMTPRSGLGGESASKLSMSGVGFFCGPPSEVEEGACLPEGSGGTCSAPRLSQSPPILQGWSPQTCRVPPGSPCLQGCSTLRWWHHHGSQAQHIKCGNSQDLRAGR